MTLTEAQIQAGLRDALERLGFTVYSTRFSVGSDVGFPDILAVTDDGLIVAIECKGPKGQLRRGQREWIERFGQVAGCIFAHVVGPETTEHWLGYDEALAAIQFEVEEARSVHLEAAG